MVWQECDANLEIVFGKPVIIFLMLETSVQVAEVDSKALWEWWSKIPEVGQGHFEDADVKKNKGNEG